jgi:hypothetical protein
MTRNRSRWRTLLLAVTAALVPATAALAQQQGPTLKIGGTTYTKWLAGNQLDNGAMFNFTTIPGEGWGDNGIGTEVELLLNAKLSSQVEVRGRIHSRFNQNFWTNFGGFGTNPPGPNNPCQGGNCGEWDPRANLYLKLRGLAVTLTPGYLVDSATIGSSDFGMFDAHVVGRLRYIDRDNAYGFLFQGSAFERRLAWDAARIALPRLWAGPGFNTGNFHAADAAYVGQARYTFNEMFDVGAIFNYNSDTEVDPRDTNMDNGRTATPRFRNGVGGLKANFHLGSWLDVRGAAYRSYSNADKGLRGDYNAVPVGRLEDNTFKLDITLNDPLENGLSLNVQAFSIGANYVSLMAARRESDVLLTEGHDGSFGFPGPSNAAFGVFRGNPTRIGYGGWTGETQQVATVNVDNDFTDFNEPWAQSVIGWQGLTFNPVYSSGSLDLAGEYSYITYDTNWQAFDDDSTPLGQSIYPLMERDTGVGHNFRTAYAPFQDKFTHLGVVKGRYVLDIGNGVDVFGKVKFIHEQDRRLNDEKYLPYQANDCANGEACANRRREYSPGLSTADLYGNPNIITGADGRRGYQWKPFDNIADDDRVLNYTAVTFGAGYQLTDDLYMSLSYSKFLADLVDGNTAFQAYNLHEMASGFHDKNQFLLKAKYILAGVEIGFEGQWAFGTFTPDFGDGFVPVAADENIAKDYGVPAGSPGFFNRFGGWNSLERRNFDHLRFKTFLKAQF